MPEGEEYIDPSKYTVKTLVQVMYHEIRELKAKIENLAHFDAKLTQQNERILKMETRLEEEEKSRKRSEDNSKWWMAGIGLAITIINFLIGFLMR